MNNKDIYTRIAKRLELHLLRLALENDTYAQNRHDVILIAELVAPSWLVENMKHFYHVGAN